MDLFNKVLVQKQSDLTPWLYRQGAWRVWSQVLLRFLLRHKKGQVPRGVENGTAQSPKTRPGKSPVFEVLQ